MTALAWCAFLALTLVLRDRWWAWTVVGLLPDAAYLVTPVLLLVALAMTGPAPRRTVAALGCLVSVGVAAGWNGIAATPPPPATGTGEPVRVAVWNTEFWHQDESPEGFGRELRALDADLYLLQEHGVPSVDGGITGLTAGTELRQWFPGFHVTEVGDLLTVSRWPVTDVEASPDDSALATTVQTPSGPVTAVNVHTVAPFDLTASPWGRRFWDEMRTRDSVLQRQLDDVATMVDQSEGPLLVAGDVNSTASMRSLTDRFGLRDAVARPLTTTWRTAGLPAWRLDWHLVSEQVSVEDVTLNPWSQFSDHRAVSLDLRFPDARTTR